MNKADPVITVIIPVYNTKKYLSECLDSVIHQTLSDIDILCINDASPDGSLRIMQEYSRLDPRIRILSHPENKGLLAAWRTGVENALGEYIIFVDSDDSIDPDLCAVVYDLIKHYDTDLLRFSAKIINCEKNTDWINDPEFVSLKGSDILSHFYSDKHISTNCWGKIYRTELLRKSFSRIPEIAHFPGQDVLITFITAYFANSFVSIRTDAKYNYNFGRGISSSQYISLEKFSRYCEMSRYLPIAKAFLEQEKASETAFSALDQMALRLIRDCCTYYLLVPDEDKKQAFEIFWDRWSGNPNFREGIYSFQKYYKAQQKQIKAQKRIIRKKDALIKEICNSRSYKLGNFLITPLHFVKEFIKKIKK